MKDAPKLKTCKNNKFRVCNSYQKLKARGLFGNNWVHYYFNTPLQVACGRT